VLVCVVNEIKQLCIQIAAQHYYKDMLSIYRLTCCVERYGEVVLVREVDSCWLYEYSECVHGKLYAIMLETEQLSGGLHAKSPKTSWFIARKRSCTYGLLARLRSIR
jgi:hypothetical protein